MPDFRTVVFLVGVMLLFIAVMMLLPLGVSLYYQDGDTSALLWSLIITAVAGMGMILFRRRGKDIGLREGFAVVALGWASAAFAGSLPFYISGAIPTFTYAMFESMSGFTTTGASI